MGKTERLEETVSQKEENNYKEYHVYRRLYPNKLGNLYRYLGKKTHQHKERRQSDPESCVIELYFGFPQSSDHKNKAQ